MENLSSIYSGFLNEELDKNKIYLSEIQKSQLLGYMNSLLDINHQINLTRITDPKEFILKHLIDSLLILPFIRGEDIKIIDVGTGGGFPGIPLAIALPDAHVVLLDSTAKKLRVVESIAKENDIDNVLCVHARAEVAGRLPAYRDQFDYVVSRAVASLPILLELCLPFLKPGGSFIALKNTNYKEELDKSSDILKSLSGEIGRIKEYSLSPELEDHVFIEIVKKDKTPQEYPREYNIIKKSTK